MMAPRLQDDSSFASRSRQDANLKPIWANLGSTWAKLGPTWPYVGCPDPKKSMIFAWFLKVFDIPSICVLRRTRELQDGLKTTPRAPKRRPRGPKTAPRGSKRAPRGAKRTPGRAPEGPQDGRKSPPSRFQVAFNIYLMSRAPPRGAQEAP